MGKAVIVAPSLAALTVLLPQGDSMSGVHEFEDSLRPTCSRAAPPRSLEAQLRRVPFGSEPANFSVHLSTPGRSVLRVFPE
jgi:hypothetical protein